MPSVPFKPVPPIDEKNAIAQVNGTLREILAQLETMTRILAALAATIGSRP